MKCEIVKKKLSAYLDQELTNSERVSIEKHLSDCHACQEELDQLIQTWNLLDNWGEIEASADFNQKVLQKINYQKTEFQNLIKSIFNIPVFFSMIIVLAIGLVLGNYLSNSFFEIDMKSNLVKNTVMSESENIPYLDIFDAAPANSIESVYIDMISMNENNSGGIKNEK